MIGYLSDCCLEIVIVGATPALVLNDGDVDPFTGEEIGWPSPRVYWSNGTITDGYWEDQTDEHEQLPSESGTPT